MLPASSFINTLRPLSRSDNSNVKYVHEIELYPSFKFYI